MGKRKRAFELKYSVVMETLLFETMERPPRSIEFSFKDLERWGYNLAKGTRENKPAYFLVEIEDAHKVGDQFKEGERSFEIETMLDKFPEDTKMFGHIEMAEGTAWFALEFKGEVSERQLGYIPASELLLYYLSKHHLDYLIKTLQGVGIMTELEFSKGQSGRAIPREDIPAKFKKFLRSAHKIGKDMGCARVALTYFGQNKDGKDRFRINWLVPTLSLMELDRAKKIDKLLKNLE